MFLVNRKIIKYSTVPIILAAFFLISEFVQQKEITTFDVDEEVFKLVDSQAELQKFIPVTSISGIPNYYNLVQAYQLYTSYDDQTFQVPGTRRTLKINQIWNYGSDIFIHYSMNMLPRDDDPETMPYVFFKEMTLHNGNEKLQMNIQDPDPLQYHHWQNDGVVFERNIHRILHVKPKMNQKIYSTLLEWSGGETNPHLMERAGITEVERLTIENVQLITLKEDELQEKKEITSITLPVSFINRSTALEKIPLDQVIQTNETYTLTLKRYEMSFIDDRLYFQVSPSIPEGSELFFIRDGVIYNQTRVQMNKNGETFINIYPPHRKEKQIEMEMQSFEILDRNQLEFTITEQDLAAYRSLVQKSGKSVSYSVDRNIGKVNHISFDLMNLRGNISNSDDANFTFELMFTAKGDLDTHFRFDGYFQGENSRDPSTHKYPVIEVYNEKGERLQIDTRAGYKNVDGKVVQVFDVKNEAIQNANELKVKLYNIPKILPFKKNKIKFTQPTLKTSY
ncbi:hypothetical protein [Alkalihalobacillus sp. AL-G]|uniref:hypothetical protein n=1 Tax=Alkalihalobacillus sp. AL-G TaxID=2926399 RepID=UPI00272CADEE|nr:hypothetical protein [Alkalihalobacillus sp. AL-G]WLD91507.1 hypothetical protein MOJ78_10640 [Alkalihalobacillus sp. AL-G]